MSSLVGLNLGRRSVIRLMSAFLAMRLMSISLMVTSFDLMYHLYLVLAMIFPARSAKERIIQLIVNF